jgi:hypothetical protein
MEPKVIEWDGTHLPEALRKFPAGRYAIEPIDQRKFNKEKEIVVLYKAKEQARFQTMKTAIKQYDK